MRTLIFLALLASISFARYQTQTTRPKHRSKTTYLLLYRPGPAWVPGKPVTEQPLKEHGKYMLGLYINGTLRFAGPLLDDTGGAVVFEAENNDEAKAIVAADPAVASHVFLPELHPWKLVDWDQYVK